MRTIQDSYLSLLRWDSPLHIVVVSGILLGAISPVAQEVIATTMFLGMVLRTRSCGIRPTVMPPGLGRGFIVLIPLWPALVAVDDMWTWMQRIGFGPAFRIGVTLTLFSLTWMPFLELSLPYGAPLLVLSGAAAAVLRERRSDYAFLVPSVVPIAMLGAQW